MKTTVRVLFLLPLLLLSGCFSLPRENLEIVRYSFYPEEFAPPEPSGFDRSLVIMPFISGSMQPGDRIVYLEKEQRMAPYYYHRWVSSPEQICTDLLTGDLVRSGLFHDGVFQMTTGLTPTHELQGRLVSLYADNRKSREAAVVEIVVSIFRIEPSTFDKRLLLQKPYRYRVDRRNDRVESFVPAATEAMVQWLADVRADLTSLLETETPAPSADQP